MATFSRGNRARGGWKGFFNRAPKLCIQVGAQTQLSESKMVSNAPNVNPIIFMTSILKKGGQLSLIGGHIPRPGGRSLEVNDAPHDCINLGKGRVVCKGKVGWGPYGLEGGF